MLTKTVTKAFPTDNTVGIHLVLTDDNRPDKGSGAQKVIDQDFMENFTGGDMTTEVKQAIGKQAQKAIDSYKARAQRFASVAYETGRSQIDAGLVLLLMFCLLLVLPQTSLGALTITSSVIDDWAAVAAQATDESTVIDISSNYVTAVHIQAFLDSTTAHEGTEFRVQVSGNSSGDEDWTDYSVFRALVGTANSEAQTENPLAVGQTVINCSDTGGLYETEPMGKWIAIEDGTLVNSELMWLTGYVTDTSVTVQDGTTVEHAQNVLMYDIAISRTIFIALGAGSRARVICNNGIDMDGTASTLNWKVGKTVATGL